MKQVILTGFIFLLSIAIIAQEATCPIVERAAVSEANVWCADLSLGQACYGNSGINADLLSDNAFNVAGDTVSLTDMSQISTFIDVNLYGVALIHTTGYAPDNWQAQSVALAILGDVSISNTGNEGINLVTITAAIIGEQGANIRSGPTPDYRLITPLFEGDLVNLTGRLSDNSAYRVQLPNGETGWLASATINADVSNLAIVTIDDSVPDTIYAPYTSFSLETEQDDAACTEAWESGVLLQSPLDQTVRIRVNDFDVTVTGTVFLQASENDTYIHVIEGQIDFTEENVVEGYSLTLGDSQISIEAYNIARFAPLPTQILPRYTYIGIDIETIVTVAPSEDRSPIADVLVDDLCVITTGLDGANLRAGPGSEFTIRAVLAYRETVNPIGRTIGSDGLIWYELAQNLWVSSQVVVTGGDCFAVPQSERIPLPLPTATPEN